ncbi:MAG: ArgR family transcriptional regulator [Acidobacteriia bacterium]|nr:ArgR family transcriptional regulator [Terriglobia bacterium]
MDKIYRRTQILDLLRSEEIETQRDLRRKLARRGLHVTQATVSRDIEELGLVKTRIGYRPPEPAEPVALLQPTLPVVLKEFLTDARQAANLVVLKTRPGNAHSVAVALDAEPWKEVVGTVAGDDTILVATPNSRQAAEIRKRILSLVAT